GDDGDEINIPHKNRFLSKRCHATQCRTILGKEVLPIRFYIPSSPEKGWVGFYGAKAIFGHAAPNT
ncbi:hypothetical protein AVEN_114478-2-1, partial [Araneus ventricosus]